MCDAESSFDAITGVSWAEFNSNDEQINLVNYLDDVNFVDGDSFEIQSVSRTLSTDLDVDEQLGIVVDYVQLIVHGVTATGDNETIAGDFEWQYKNSCDESDSVTIKDGDELAFIVFSEVEEQLDAFCPADYQEVCVDVNHQYDFPGEVTCDCVSPQDPCLTDMGPDGAHCIPDESCLEEDPAGKSEKSPAPESMALRPSKTSKRESRTIGKYGSRFLENDQLSIGLVTPIDGYFGDNVQSIKAVGPPDKLFVGAVEYTISRNPCTAQSKAPWVVLDPQGDPRTLGFNGDISAEVPQRFREGVE